MQDFTGKSYTTSPQHVEATDCRLKRDAADAEKIMAKLKVCSPFSDDAYLRNIVNGIVAANDVNVDIFETVGRQTVEKTIGNPIFTHKFKR